MKDVLKRLKALEMRAIKDDDRWQNVEGLAHAVTAILLAVIEPICDRRPELLNKIISSLRTYEADAKLLNETSAMISLIHDVAAALERLR